MDNTKFNNIKIKTNILKLNLNNINNNSKCILEAPLLIPISSPIVNMPKLYLDIVTIPKVYQEY